MSRMILLLMVVISFSITINAAEVSVTVHGSVTDSTGKIVPGAEVMFISGSDTVSAFTDADGHYKLVLRDMTTGIQENTALFPFALSQNYPNPFNPTTTIPFSLASPEPVSLDIFSITGQHVRTLVDGYLGVGMHTVVWDGVDDAGNGVSAGVYLYRLSTGTQVGTRKMLLLDGNSAGAKYTGTAQQHSLKSADTAAGKTYAIRALKNAHVPYQEGYFPPTLQYIESIDISFGFQEFEKNITFSDPYESYSLYIDSTGILNQYALAGETLDINLVYFHDPLPLEGTISLASQSGDRETVTVSGSNEYGRALSYCGYSSVYFLDSRQGTIETSITSPVPGDGILQTHALSDTITALFVSSWGDTTSTYIPIFDTLETVELWGRTYHRWNDRWYWLDGYNRWILNTEDQFYLTLNDSVDVNTINAFIEENNLQAGKVRDNHLIININLDDGLGFLVELQNNPIIKDGYYLEEVCLCKEAINYID